jgi:hypothetical protein
MDIEHVISQLRAEQKRLDGIIATLERLSEEHVARSPQKRGRKFMDKKSRAAVSERMKRYWREKRKRDQAACRLTVNGDHPPVADGHADKGSRAPA